MAESVAVGDKFVSSPLIMTRERMRWYCDALETAASPSGQFIIAEPTIHTDDEYARENGLPGIVADGMISTNYISSLLYRTFGVPYLAGGELRTKFIRPVVEDAILQAHAVVAGEQDGTITLDVWVEDEAGQKVTVGDARVPAQGRKA